MMTRLVCAIPAVLSAGVLLAAMEPATPESQGVDSQGILDFIDAAERTFGGSPKDGSFHGFVILRHGKVVAEGSWKPFDTLNEPHMLYSHSKSFTSTAVGFVVDEGKLDLDERVIDIFSNDVPAKVSENLAQLRVRDLLTMNVGKKDHILGKKGNWVRTFLAQDFFLKPGTRFKYDSDATYMQAAIVEKKTGERMMDYLKRKLFDKIGITTVWTTFSPQGIPCGGWGMNMTTRELARFGQFYLQKGRWEGEQLLSPDWVTLATSRETWCNGITIQNQTIGSGSDWNQGYGFQFWRCRHGAFRADGAAGQYTVIMPEQDMVVSIHAGLNNMQTEINLIWDHLIPACRKDALPENAALQAKLADRLANLELRPLECVMSAGTERKVYGHRFLLKKNNRGFESILVTPAPSGDGFLATIVTRAGEQRIPVGKGEWAKGALRIDTEDFEALGAYIGEHRTAASGGFGPDGTFRMRAYLTGTPGFLYFELKPEGGVSGLFWAMGGCRFEGREAEAK